MNISRRHLSVIAGIVFSLIGPGSAWANTKFLNVQGRLTDTSGNPLTGSQTVTFRLYTSSTGGSASWTESQAVVLSTGLFNVALGSVTTLDSLSFDQLYYLGIQVAGDGSELSPRQQLGASAYAQGSLGNFNVGNNLVVSSSITANGPVWIGGQTLIVGTMTVQGGGSSFVVVASSVGVRTASPATALDVNGSAQFGSGATKSTFTASGSLTLNGAASITAASATFSASGANVYSLTTSSGIHVLAGGVTWADGSTSTSAAVVTSMPLPTRQVLTSGTGATYSTPTGARQIRIRMVGGGGGGGGTHTGAGAGGNGGDTSFNSIVAKGGGGGPTGSNAPGAGGYGGAGSASFRVAGATAPWNIGYGTGEGGDGPWGGAGAGVYNGSIGAGNPGAANSGSGGGSNWCNGCTPGFSQGGGAGEYVELIINSPSSTYTYTVGSGGAAGASNTYKGGAGGSGVIIVDEYY